MDGDVHLEGRLRCPLFGNVVFSGSKHQGPIDIELLLAKEMVLGPTSLEERPTAAAPLQFQ